MSPSSLQDTIEKLSLSPRVKGLFTTGTTASGLTPSSDIDLVVILDKNNEGIKSAYTMIENRFADIFFFDLDFVKACERKQEVSANAFEGMFLSWLAKGKIYKDANDLLADLQKKAPSKLESCIISTEEKRDSWFKINYNFIANRRYFVSDEKTYHRALELRLLYSVPELIVAYFAFRNIPWRGEKTALTFLEKHDLDVYGAFMDYVNSSSLKERFYAYQNLFTRVLSADYEQWDEDFIVTLNMKHQIDDTLNAFWIKLLDTKEG